MKEEPKLECAREVEYVAGQDIDTGLLMEFVYAQQNIDWKAFSDDFIAKGTPKELVYGYVNGALHMLDELIAFLVKEGAFVEVRSNEA